MAAQIATMNTMAIVPNIANLFVAWREDFMMIVWITSFGWVVFNFFCFCFCFVFVLFLFLFCFCFLCVWVYRLYIKTK